MSHRTAVLGALAGAAVFLGSPAAASAATGTIAKPCYTHTVTQGTEPIVVALTGGTPNAPFVVYATAPGKAKGSQGSAGGTFDPAGNGTATIADVFPPSGSIKPLKGDPVVLSVADFGAGGVDTPFGPTLITNLALDVSTKPRSPRAKRSIKLSGTPFANQPVYGFVVKGTNPKVLRKINLGTADGCGYLSSKGVVAPKSFRRGTYRLYVNAGPTLNKDLAIGFSFRITRSLL